MCRGKRRESPTSHLSQQMQLLSFPLWSSRCLKVILEARLRYRLDNMHGGLGDCSAPSFQIFIVSSIYLSLYMPLKCDSASCAGNKVGKQLATRKSKCWMLLYCQESPVFWSAASPRTPLHCCQELCLESLSLPLFSTILKGMLSLITSLSAITGPGLINTLADWERYFPDNSMHKLSVHSSY